MEGGEKDLREVGGGKHKQNILFKKIILELERWLSG